jgi:HD-GYP domain-containing protein (c-di-GMP phosphodiesterase class II)
MAFGEDKEQINIVKSMIREEQVQKLIVPLRNHHLETYRHSVRVALLSLKLGVRNRFSDYRLRLVGYSGLLHDIGKRKIPKDILSKPGNLDEDEIKLLDSHPEEGFKLLEDFEEQMVRHAVVSHHEYKVNPYPRSLERRIIPREGNERRRIFYTSIELAQIVAVADIYDALSSQRSYKEALPREEVKRLMGEQFKGPSRYLYQVLDI